MNKFNVGISENCKDKFTYEIKWNLNVLLCLNYVFLKLAGLLQYLEQNRCL